MNPQHAPADACNTQPTHTGILYAGSLWLSNSAYLYLSVSFIQMTKSLMPGLVYACGCAVGTERFRNSVAANMGLIALGVVVCAMGEMNLVVTGLIQQLAALVFEVRRAVARDGGLAGVAGCATVLAVLVLEVRHWEGRRCLQCSIPLTHL